MKTIMCVSVHVEDFERRIVSLPDDHPLVSFSERWKTSGQGDGWIDLSSDMSSLIEAWWSAEEEPELPLPTTIDHVVFGVAY